jgi:hypothetical protein
MQGFPTTVRRFENTSRCRAAGCHYYLRKPYDPNALLTLIHQAIDEAPGR